MSISFFIFYTFFHLFSYRVGDLPFRLHTLQQSGMIRSLRPQLPRPCVYTIFVLSLLHSGKSMYYSCKIAHVIMLTLTSILHVSICFILFDYILRLYLHDIKKKVPDSFLPPPSTAIDQLPNFFRNARSIFIRAALPI